LGEECGVVKYDKKSKKIGTIQVPIQNFGVETSASVHVDFSADGRISEGDYINSESFLVQKNATPQVQVFVEEI